jgi:uncharacterized integral membrane protein
MLYIAIVLFVLVSAGLIVLALANLLTDVSFSLIVWQIHVPLGVLLLLAFVLGAVLLYIVSTASAWQDTQELKRLRLRVAELERTATSISTGPLSGGAPIVPIVPMPGMPAATDISDMTTQH